MDLSEAKTSEHQSINQPLPPPPPMANLLVQLATEDGKPKLVCHICQKSLFSLNSYVKHLKKHEAPGGFICPYCQERFCMQSALDAHKDEKHKILACKICEPQQTFDNADQYKSHIVDVHNGIDRIYCECEKCGVKFKTKESLKRHVDSKCGTVKSHKCNQCEAMFYTKYHLATHLQLHGEATFCCSYCGKEFKNKARLICHERQHSGEKPYQCDVCQKSFAHRESLVTHASIHTGIKRIECRCCAARFSCHSNLIKHRRARADSCGLPQFDPDKTMRKRSSIEPRIPPTLMKSEIKVGKSTKVLRPGHSAVKAPGRGKAQPQAKVERIEDMADYSDDNDYYNDDTPFVENDDYDEPEDNGGEFGVVGPFMVEVVPSTSSSIPMTIKKTPKPRKSRKVENIDIDNDMGVFNDLPEVERSDSEGEEMLNNSDPINYHSQSILAVKKEKEDFDFTIFNEKDDILNNLISESNENEVNVKLEPIYKVELPESHQTLGPMVDPLGNPPATPSVLLEETKHDTPVDIDDYMDDGHFGSFTPEIEIKEIPKMGRWKRNTTNVSESEDVKFIPTFPALKRYDESSTSESDDSSDVSFKMSIGKVKSTAPKKPRGPRGPKKADTTEIDLLIKQEAVRIKKEKLEQKEEKKKIDQEKKEKRAARGSILKKIKELKKLQVRQKTYECPEPHCVKIYHFRGAFEKHLRQEHGKTEQFVYEFLKEDIVNIPDELGSKCPICGKFYVMEKRLRDHIQFHGPAGDLIFKCPCYCNVHFRSKDEAFEHAKVEHKQQLYCELCDKFLLNPDALTTHRRSIHEGRVPERKINRERNLVCGKCGKRFGSRTYLDNHERSDCGTNPIYKCTVCGKGFSTAGILKTHQLLHKDDTPFICHICGKPFKVQSQYKTHIRIRHTDEKPFKCELCPKAYPYRQSLFCHMTVHTGFKRFRCQGCEGRFTCISNLQAHRKAHPETCGQLPLDSKPVMRLGYLKGKLWEGRNPEKE
ncbi:hypothetical protein ACFFRR_004001 [Megaselia abdita]